MHLKALVDRNLIFVHQHETNGNMKSYSIHDLLRDLCVRKAREEKFLFAGRGAPDDLVRSTSCLRRVCYHGSFSIEDAHISTEQIRLARSFLSFNGIEESISPGISQLRLLRVLDILWTQFYEFPEEILQLVNLRYLALTVSQTLPSSISRRCNLQTLIVHNNLLAGGMLMRGILDMTQLRHIKFKGLGTYVEYHGEDKNCFVVLDKLPIPISEITDMLLKTLPNFEKLGIFCEGEVDGVRDLSRLHKLHTLKCISSMYRGNFLSNLIFPQSLKKLSLSYLRILDHHMNEIGTLPNLQTLKLICCDFKSGKWEAEDGGKSFSGKLDSRRQSFPKT
ncbi:Disease resistance protein RPP13 [Sesamum alatum]|uniref:Disease resistance protein RPP13 n=1 Tax=Sesamum alatum TaxID=300844 RepID=A0AAE1YDQ1_9LAMI|nr:Disease resistance protein RPP13 [Sesamum alatum]